MQDAHSPYRGAMPMCSSGLQLHRRASPCTVGIYDFVYKAASPDLPSALKSLEDQVSRGLLLEASLAAVDGRPTEGRPLSQMLRSGRSTHTLLFHLPIKLIYHPGLGLVIDENNSVVKVIEGGAASATVRKGDEIVRVDGDLLARRRVRDVLIRGRESHVLRVRRLLPAFSEFLCRAEGGLGMEVDARNAITSLVPDGNAAVQGLLRPGDVILAVDGVALEGRSIQDALAAGREEHMLQVCSARDGWMQLAVRSAECCGCGGE